MVSVAADQSAHIINVENVEVPILIPRQHTDRVENVVHSGSISAPHTPRFENTIQNTTPNKFSRIVRHSPCIASEPSKRVDSKEVNPIRNGGTNCPEVRVMREPADLYNLMIERESVRVPQDVAKPNRRVHIIDCGP